MDNKNSNFSAKRISFSGILLAISIILIYFASFLPTSRLSLYALSSFLISVIVIEFGIKSGLLFYIASTVLSLIILPDKLGIIPYVLFFGIYGVVKYFIEKINIISIEYILKLVYFNFIIFISYLLVKNILFESISIKISWWAILIIFEAVFVIFDYIYTLFIQYYESKLKKILNFYN